MDNTSRFTRFKLGRKDETRQVMDFECHLAVSTLGKGIIVATPTWILIVGACVADDRFFPTVLHRTAFGTSVEHVRINDCVGGP